MEENYKGNCSTAYLKIKQLNNKGFDSDRLEVDYIRNL